MLVTMFGGLGILIGVILFLVWRKSTKAWQRVLAWIGGIGAGISILFYIFVYFSLNLNAGITPTPTPIPVKPTATPEIFMTAQVRGYTINVRRGPGTQYDILGKIPAGAQVKVKGRNQDSSWVLVVTDSVTGWASFDLLYFPTDVAELPIMVANGNQSIITQATENLASITPTPIPTKTPTKILTKKLTKVPTKINPTSTILYCKDTDNRIGEFVYCKIPRAYCSYEPATDGSPTFCNDAPPPNFNFTLLVWGEDWSDYDGKCIVVYGYVSLYNGKPQIEGSIRSQVSMCP